LSDDETLPELKKIKTDLDVLIDDTVRELSGSDVLRKAVVNY